MSCLSRFKLITLDVGDTLLKFRRSPAKQWGDIGALFGVVCKDDELVTHFKANWHKMNKAHPNFGLKSKIYYEEWWKRLILGTIVGDMEPHKISEEKITKITNYFLDIYKTSNIWQNCYGSIDFLNYLKQLRQYESQNGKYEPHFKLGAISNSDARLDVLLKNMKINQYFDFVLSSYNAGCMKPDKAIFHKAMDLSEIKGLKPEECLHIGDTPICDYFGAKSAGWNSVLIHDREPESLRQKYGPNIEDHHVISSLFDLHKKISSDNMKF